MMGIRAIAKRIRASYSTVRGWLARMKDGDLERRFDKKRPVQKRQLDEHMVHATRRWLGNPPNLHGFRAGAWSLDMPVQSIRWRFGVTYRERTMRRILDALGYSYRKPRPIPEKSATPEEQKEFMDSTNRLVVDRMERAMRYCAETRRRARDGPAAGMRGVPGAGTTQWTCRSRRRRSRCLGPWAEKTTTYGG